MIEDLAFYPCSGPPGPHVGALGLSPRAPPAADPSIADRARTPYLHRFAACDRLTTLSRIPPRCGAEP